MGKTFVIFVTVWLAFVAGMRPAGNHMMEYEAPEVMEAQGQRPYHASYPTGQKQGQTGQTQNTHTPGPQFEYEAPEYPVPGQGHSASQGQGHSAVNGRGPHLNNPAMEYEAPEYPETQNGSQNVGTHTGSHKSGPGGLPTNANPMYEYEAPELPSATHKKTSTSVTGHQSTGGPNSDANSGKMLRGFVKRFGKIAQHYQYNMNKVRTALQNTAADYGLKMSGGSGQGNNMYNNTATSKPTLTQPSLGVPSSTMTTHATGHFKPGLGSTATMTGSYNPQSSINKTTAFHNSFHQGITDQQSNHRNTGAPSSSQTTGKQPLNHYPIASGNVASKSTSNGHASSGPDFQTIHQAIMEAATSFFSGNHAPQKATNTHATSHSAWIKDPSMFRGAFSRPKSVGMTADKIYPHLNGSTGNGTTLSSSTAVGNTTDTTYRLRSGPASLGKTADPFAVLFPPSAVKTAATTGIYSLQRAPAAVGKAADTPYRLRSRPAAVGNTSDTTYPAQNGPASLGKTADPFAFLFSPSAGKRAAITGTYSLQRGPAAVGNTSDTTYPPQNGPAGLGKTVDPFAFLFPPSAGKTDATTGTYSLQRGPAAVGKAADTTYRLRSGPASLGTTADTFPFLFPPSAGKTAATTGTYSLQRGPGAVGKAADPSYNIKSGSTSGEKITGTTYRLRRGPVVVVNTTDTTYRLHSGPAAVKKTANTTYFLKNGSTSGNGMTLSSATAVGNTTDTTYRLLSGPAAVRKTSLQSGAAAVATKTTTFPLRTGSPEYKATLSGMTDNITYSQQSSSTGHGTRLSAPTAVGKIADATYPQPSGSSGNVRGTGKVGSVSIVNVGGATKGPKIMKQNFETPANDQTTVSRMTETTRVPFFPASNRSNDIPPHSTMGLHAASRHHPVQSSDVTGGGKGSTWYPIPGSSISYAQLRANAQRRLRARMLNFMKRRQNASKYGLTPKV